MTEKVCVIGLGTIGCPTALHISEFYTVVGYDLSKKVVEKVNESGLDATFEKMPLADVYVIAVSTDLKGERGTITESDI